MADNLSETKLAARQRPGEWVTDPTGMFRLQWNGDGYTSEPVRWSTAGASQEEALAYNVALLRDSGNAANLAAYMKGTIPEDNGASTYLDPATGKLVVKRIEFTEEQEAANALRLRSITELLAPRPASATVLGASQEAPAVLKGPESFTAAGYLPPKEAKAASRAQKRMADAAKPKQVNDDPNASSHKRESQRADAGRWLLLIGVLFLLFRR